MSTNEKPWPAAVEPPKPAIHTSLLSTLSKCGLQVQFRWLDGIKVPPGFAAHVGSAVHRAAELDLRHKMAKGSPAPTEAVVTRAREALKAVVEGEGVLLDDEEKTVGMPTLIAKAQDEASSLAMAHNRSLTPVLTPIHVERPLRLELKGFDYDLEGTVDVQEDGAIWDLKTASRAPDEDAASGHPQLDTYAMLLSLHEQTPLKTVGLNTLVKSKTKLPNVVRTSAPAPRSFGAIIGRIERAAHVLKTGAFYPVDPTGPSAWVCTPKFCGYYDRCPFGAARRKQFAVKESTDAS